MSRGDDQSEETRQETGTEEMGVTYVCSLERALVGNRELEARCGSGMDHVSDSRMP